MTDVQFDETELFTQTVLPLKYPVMTLSWQGDDLVDWAGGHTRFVLDGTVLRGGYLRYSNRFNAAVSSPDGDFVAIYERLGTKALLLHDGKLLRELNRSYYCADVTDYPIGFVVLPNGRAGIIHCPDEYCRLEIEDALTAERLTAAEREPEDFFHSRLVASPGGTCFMSAGWVWHPWDGVLFFDVAQALSNPRSLDEGKTMPGGLNVDLTEESSAAWLDDSRVIIAASVTPEVAEEAQEQPDLRLRTRGIAVFDVTTDQCLSSAVLPEVAGTLMAVGENHVLSLYGEPKLLEIATGKEIYRWKGLDSGHQASSIIGGLEHPIPPMALDSRRGRFAIASDESITVVQFKLDALRRLAEKSS